MICFLVWVSFKILKETENKSILTTVKLFSFSGGLFNDLYNFDLF